MQYPKLACLKPFMTVNLIGSLVRSVKFQKIKQVNCIMYFYQYIVLWLLMLSICCECKLAYSTYVCVNDNKFGMKLTVKGFF